VEGGYQELSKNTCKFDKQRQGVRMRRKKMGNSVEKKQWTFYIERGRGYVNK
jgi:hypothetical protein